MSGKILIGISGKVESLVTAWLLKKQGRQLRGVFFDLTQSEEVRNQIFEFERKLGISIQIIPAQDLLLPVLTPYFEESLVTGIRINLKKLVHQKIFFPELFKIQQQHHFEGISGGYRVLLQHDPVSNLMKIMGYEDPKEDEAEYILGLTQKEIALLEFPLGSIPLKMIRRIAVELELGQEQGLFEVNWDALKNVLMAHFTKEISKTISLYLDNGNRVGSCPDYTLYNLGSPYQMEGNGVKVQENWGVVEMDPRAGHMKIGDLNKRVIQELELSDVSWVTRADLGLSVLKTVMIWKNGAKKIPVKLIQFEENKVKAILETPLKGSEANLYQGETVMWMSGNELLGGARVSKVK